MPVTVTCNLAVTFSPSVVEDAHTHWTIQLSQPVGVLSAALAAADTTLTLQAPAANVNVGDSIIIADDPMIVTAIDGAQLTVQRWAAAFPFMASVGLAPSVQEHAIGATVASMLYKTPWMCIASEALLPWAQSITLRLGNKSATFGSSATGTLTLNM